MRNKLAKGILSGMLLMGLVAGAASVAGADEPAPGQAPATPTKDAATNGDTKVATEPVLSERTLPSGVKIIEQRAGVAGAQPGDIVLVHYTGTLENGKKFDSSLDRGQPFRFTLGSGQVIKGWDAGIQGMLVGEKRKLIIPADMAYGERETGPIPANSTLIFEVELIGLVRQTPPAH